MSPCSVVFLIKLNSYFSSAIRPSFTTLINSAISQAPDEFTSSIADEDSDEWLSIDADHFEEILQGHNHKNKQSEAMNIDGTLAQDASSTQASQLRDLASKVEEFIEGEGDVEGARFAE